MGETSGIKSEFDSILPNDPWTISFDVDLNFDGTKAVVSGLSEFESHEEIYNDIHPLSGLLPRFDELHSSNTSQINHKIETDYSPALLAKISCSETNTDNEVDPQMYSLSNCGNDSKVCNSLDYNNQYKPSTDTTDVYGHIIRYDGRLVLQLRHFNLNTNYPLRLNECWMCGEKIVDACSMQHKHVLQGSFQINCEYVQMDIDHFLMPEQAFEPSVCDLYATGEIASNMFQSAEFQDINPNKDVDLNDSLGVENVTLEENNVVDIAHSTDTDNSLVSSLTSNCQCFSTSFVYNSACNRLPSDTVNNSTVSSGENLHNPVLTSTMFSMKEGVDSSIITSKSHVNTKHISRFRNHKSHCESSEAHSNCSYSYLSTTSLSALKHTSNSIFDALSQISSSRAQSGKENSILESSQRNQKGAKKRKSKTQRKAIHLKNDCSDTFTTNKDNNCRNTLSVKESAVQALICATSRSSEEVSNNLKNMSDGITENGLSSEDYELVCWKCKKKFQRNFFAYKMHIRKHGISDSEMYGCQFCLKKFKIRSTFIQHIKEHKTCLKCEECDNTYSRKDKLQRHKRTHTNNRPFPCHKCKKAFNRKEYLKMHLEIHSGIKYVCKTCGSSFSSKYNLKTHERKAHVKQNFSCKVCNKSFSFQVFLNKHIEQIHKSNKEKCNQCGRFFSRKDVLNRHMLAAHLKNATYSCDICNAKFIRKDTLKVHLKTHSEDKVYKCSKCTISYKRKDLLVKHEKQHETKLQCQDCCRFFSNKSDLKRHFKIHARQNVLPEEVTKIRCEVCSKILTSKSILKRHLQVVHGETTNFKKKKVNLCLLEGKNKLEQHRNINDIDSKKLQRGETKYKQNEKKFVCDTCRKGFTRSCNLLAHKLKSHGSNVTYQKQEMNSMSHSTLSQSSDSISNLMAGTLQFSVTPSFSPPLPSGLLAHLPLSSSHLHNKSPSESPINLSAEAITAAAYLLAYPSYPGS